MSLDDEEKAKIRLYLGWSARFHQTDSRLEQALSTVSGMAAEEALIRADLARCDAALAQLDATETTAKAVAAGPIQLRVHYQIEAILRKGAIAAKRIASVLGVPFQNNVWCGGGPLGFAGPFGQED